MTVLDSLFEEARTEVYLPRIEKPLVYEGNGGSIKAYNSGGRGLIFEDKGLTYRVKGVDPYGHLTRAVVDSGKNLISDVQIALKDADTGVFVNGSSGINEPFGTLKSDKAHREQIVTEKLNSEYKKLGVRPPYRFDETIMIEPGSVQNWFKINKPSDDLRVEELDQLLIKKFNDLTQKELEEKYRDVLKLYGRFNIWNGLGMRLMVDAKLEPTANSFLPQNYVISSVDGGYGVFRIDHTSTKYLPNKSEQDIFDGLQKNVDGFLEGSLLRIPTAMMIAAFPEMVGGEEKLRRSMKTHGITIMGAATLFESAYYYVGAVKSAFYVDKLGIIIEPFVGGFCNRSVEPIEEEFFKRVLE